MKYSFSVNLYDKDGDEFDKCILVHVGDNTMIKFKDINELEKFADDILSSLGEIKDYYL
jgi:hypothetical protein